MTLDANSYVYAYLRPDGRPCYIGKGKGQRWLHRGKAGRNKHFLSIRAQAKAAGTDLICIKLIEDLTDEQAMQIERDLIRLVGREANGGPLVNLTDGGDGPCGYKWTPEQRAAQGAKRKGRALTPEWRAAVSAGLTGKSKSPEHAAAVGAAQIGKIWAPPPEHVEHLRRLAALKPHKGHKHSEETKEIIRRAAVRQQTSAKARKAVSVSPAWMIQNSVRYPQSTAACSIGEI